MKLTNIVGAILIVCSTVAFANREVKLTWDANPKEEYVSNYIVTVNGIDQPTIATTAATVTIPDSRTIMTALSGGGKSAASTPLIIPAAPTVPKGLRVIQIIRTLVSP